MSADPGLPQLAVVIVNYNSGRLLERCLEALEGQTVRGFRTIVVDNASDDASVDDLESRFRNVTVIRSSSNLGFAAGNNLGISRAGSAEWIAMLNPDAFPQPDWLERLLEAARLHPEYTFFASRMLLAQTPERLDGTGDLYHVSGLAWRRDHGDLLTEGSQEPGEIFGPCAAAALYRRDVLREVDGFDERFFCYFEDVDLAFRLRLKGHRCLYVPQASVHHVGSAIAGRRSDFKAYHEHRNLVWAFCKNMPAILLWRYLPLHLAVNTAAVVAFAAHGRLRVILRAKYGALRALPEILQDRKRIQAARKASPIELDRAFTHGLAALWRASVGRIARW